MFGMAQMRSKSTSSSKLAEEPHERYSKAMQFTDAILVVEETKLHIVKTVSMAISQATLSSVNQLLCAFR